MFSLRDVCDYESVSLVLAVAERRWSGERAAPAGGPRRPPAPREPNRPNRRQPDTLNGERANAAPEPGTELATRLNQKNIVLPKMFFVR